MKVSDVQDELLTILMEECGEVVQIASKIRRFGFESVAPNAEHGMTNRELLQLECGDVAEMISQLARNEMVDLRAIIERRRAKRAKLREFMNFAEDLK